jgi:hypothetical protein
MKFKSNSTLIWSFKILIVVVCIVSNFYNINTVPFTILFAFLYLFYLENKIKTVSIELRDSIIDTDKDTKQLFDNQKILLSEIKVIKHTLEQIKKNNIIANKKKK